MELKPVKKDLRSSLDTAEEVLAFIGYSALYFSETPLNDQEQLGLSAVLNALKDLLAAAREQAA